MGEFHPNLFKPCNIGTLTLRNRLMMSLYPTKYIDNGHVTERMVEFFRARARGGVGVIVVDGGCLDYPEAYKGPNELRMDTDEHVESLKTLVGAVQGEGAKILMHLNYPAFIAAEPGAPGAFEKKGGWAASLVDAADIATLERVAGLFGLGAARAQEIGYDGVEIQAGWGAAVAQFLSPLSNKRTDDYGGRLDNRVRILLDIMSAVRKSVGRDFPVQVKLVADELCRGGYDIGEAEVVAKRLEAAQADSILVTIGNKKTKKHAIPSHSLPYGVTSSYARTLKDVVGIPVIAMGKINSARLADEMLGRGEADMIAMTRALIADPDLPKKSAGGDDDEVRGCIYCLDDCADKGVPGLGRACSNNPHAGLESEIKLERSREPRRVWVVGGGPAGMQAALTAASRGHYVKLFEAANHFGGEFRLASITPFKAEVGEVIRWLEVQIDKEHIDCELNHKVTAAEIIEADPHVVIIATGSRAKEPLLPGIDDSRVFSARDFLEQRIVPGQHTVVIGGGDLGCEVAEYAADLGSRAAVIELLDEVLPNTKSVPRKDLLDRLEQKGVQIYTRTAASAYRGGQVVSINKDGSEFTLDADHVVYSIGNNPVHELYHELLGKVGEIFLVGDAEEPSNVGHALRTAFRVAASI